MESIIIVVILAVVIILALIRARKHFQGGGCCGSGSNTIRSQKTLTDPILGKKRLIVEGMTCENCAIRIENALNRLDGVLCKVNLRKKTAAVSYSAEVSDDVLKAAVEKLGYTVTEVH